MRRYILILLSFAVFASCRMPEGMPAYGEAFRNRPDYCFVAGSKDMIDFSEGEPQAAFDMTKHIYRCGALSYNVYESDGSALETVEEYYNVILSENPSALLQKISRCKVVLHTSSLECTRDCGQVVVLKIVDDKAWLWSESMQWGFVVKIGAKQPVR